MAIACNNISVFDILYRYDDSYCMPNTFNIQNKAGINCLMLLIIAGTGNAMKFIERFNFLYQLTSVCDIIDFSVL